MDFYQIACSVPDGYAEDPMIAMIQMHSSPFDTDSDGYSSCEAIVWTTFNSNNDLSNAPDCAMGFDNDVMN